MGFFSEELLEMDRNTVQYMIDERDRKNEELQKKADELQSRNDELQSHNDELQNRNDELQSQNNELLAKLNLFEKQLAEQGELLKQLQEKI